MACRKRRNGSLGSVRRRFAAAPKTKQPRGIDLDARNKSVIITDKVLNSVLTFYFPEIF
jgi:hypothetical protein